MRTDAVDAVGIDMEAVKAQLTLHEERDEHAAGDTRRQAGTLMNEYPLCRKDCGARFSGSSLASRPGLRS